MIVSALDESIARFRANPLSARTTPSVTASLDEGRGRLASGPFSWQVDFPPVVGGGNQAPSPTLYLLGALAGCAVAFINDILAPQLGIDVADVRAVARCRWDLGGLLGIDGTDPRLTGLAIEVTVDSPDRGDRVEALRHAWLQRAPIYLALLNPVPIEVTWNEIGGGERQCADPCS